MKSTIIDTKGNKVSDITLNKEIFGIEPNMDVLGHYVRIHLSNKRQGTSSTKTRGDVSGSGAKPWAQKGTGRARVGSKRTPIWTHGGISHGPQPRSWNLTVQKKVKNLALFTALTNKLSTENLIVLDKFDIKDNKTSSASQMLKDLNLNRNSLFVLENAKDLIARSLKNISSVKLSHSKTLNAFDVISANKIVFTKDSLKAFVEKYKEEKQNETK